MFQKIHRQLLKHIIVARHGIKTAARTTLDIGFVTYDQKYAEYELSLHNKTLSRSQLLNFKRLFHEWQITPETDINLTEDVDKTCPFRFFLEIIAQQMNIPVKTLKIKKMTDRFRSLYPQWYGDYRFINGRRLLKERKRTVGHRILAMWDGFVRLGKCPWINKAVDEFLKKRKSQFRMRKKIVRLLAWYLVYRLHVLNNSRKSQSKRLETQNINTGHKE